MAGNREPSPEAVATVPGAEGSYAPPPSAANPASAASDAARRWVAARDLTLPAAALLTLGALAVYRTTLMPGLSFWDTGEVQTVLPVLGTMHPTGFPALVVIGWLFSVIAKPLGEPAFLMNLMAAVCAALAAGGTVLVVRRLGVPLPVALASGAGFALTPVTWHISSAAGEHALHIVLVVALTLALLRWQALVDGRRQRPGDTAYRRRGDRAVILAAAIYGVAIANHALALILAPSIVLFVLAVEPRVLLRPKLILAAVGTAVGVAALLYLELPLRAGLLPAPLVYAHPDTWSGLLDVVLARQFQGDVHGLLSGLPDKAGALLDLATGQFGVLVALLPIGLLVAAVRKPKYALFSGTAALVTVGFAGSYTNADITRYYLGPVFFGWTWLALLAGALVDAITGRPWKATAAELDEGAGTEQMFALPGWRWVAVSTAVAIAFGAALLVPTASALGDRWRVADQSSNTQAPAWLDQAFGAMAPGAVVVSWWSYSTPMWYGEYVQGRRTDIKIVDDSNLVWDHLGSASDVIGAYLGKRPVYVIRASYSDIQTLAEQYVIQPVGRPANLFLVTGRLGTNP